MLDQNNTNDDQHNVNAYMSTEKRQKCVVFGLSFIISVIIISIIYAIGSLISCIINTATPIFDDQCELKYSMILIIKLAFFVIFLIGFISKYETELDNYKNNTP
jgi:hypothetical protein